MSRDYVQHLRESIQKEVVPLDTLHEYIAELVLIRCFPDQPNSWRIHQQEYIQWNRVTQELRRDNGGPLFRHEKPGLVTDLESIFQKAAGMYFDYVRARVTEAYSEFTQTTQTEPLIIILPDKLTLPVEKHNVVGGELRYFQGLILEEGDRFRLLSKPEFGRYMDPTFGPFPSANLGRIHMLCNKTAEAHL